MRGFLSLLVAAVLTQGLAAADLPPVVREALTLELEGRLSESLERYRAALSSEPELVQDEALRKPLTVRVFSKAANLSIDLGYGEEAWDLGGRLLAAKNQRASEAGTLIRMRLLRLQDRANEALVLFESYASSWPLPPPGASLVTEALRCRRALSAATGPLEALIRKGGGPGFWTLAGEAVILPGPSDVWSLSIQETVRLQVGAFRDWAHALTLIDMLREKGWSPFTDVKTSPTGEKLHVVYLISRQPAADRSRLEAQGLTALP